MRANRAYRLLVRRGGRTPAAFADPQRVDHIEVVDIETSEVALFWDLSPKPAARLLRVLRRDLAQLEADEFITAWRDAGGRRRRPRAQ